MVGQYLHINMMHIMASTLDHTSIISKISDLMYLWELCNVGCHLFLHKLRYTACSMRTFKIVFLCNEILDNKFIQNYEKLLENGKPKLKIAFCIFAIFNFLLKRAVCGLWASAIKKLLIVTLFAHRQYLSFSLNLFVLNV